MLSPRFPVLFHTLYHADSHEGCDFSADGQSLGGSCSYYRGHTGPYSCVRNFETPHNCRF